MPICIIAGNWKMNTTLPEARELVSSMKERLESSESVERVLCPPSISLDAISGLLEGSSVTLGAQNMHSEDSGAYTGEISPSMLKGICQYVILGHSERRQIFGENDEMVNRKVKAALNTGLRPILCVGESLDDRDAGRAESFVEGP